MVEPILPVAPFHFEIYQLSIDNQIMRGRVSLTHIGPGPSYDLFFPSSSSSPSPPSHDLATQAKVKWFPLSTFPSPSPLLAD